MRPKHRLLNRQMRRYLGDESLIPADMAPFIAAINEAYHQNDIDRAMLERSLELSSQELFHSNAEMRAVFQALPDPYFRIDDEGRVLDHKSPSPKTGLFPNPIGMRLDELIPTATWNILRHQVAETIRTQALTTLASPLTITGSDTLYEARLVPIFKQQVIILLRDITNRIQAEQEREKLQNQLLQAQKMEAIGTLAGGVAHDFNNLLMGIQGYASLAFLESGGTGAGRDYLRNIEQLVKKGADLTRQLLGFARGGKYEVKTIRLNELIADTIDMFGRTKKEIAIHMKLDEPLWAVEVDRGQIEQVLLNIFINAWHAMPGGGDIHVETGNIRLDDHEAKKHDVRVGGYVRVSIADTGTGMDETTLHRIFEPFFTTKAVGKGSGLGLASAYGIIRNHGGWIDVHSTQGKGTIFRVHLPASESPLAEENRPMEQALSGHETILIVDDEPLNLIVLQRLLSGIGYKVLTSGTGEAAISVYREKWEEIDLVIMDMIMPGMSGAETFASLHKIDPAAKVILCSGYSLEGEAKAIMSQGCSGFIQKPFTVEAISRKIREALGSKL